MLEDFMNIMEEEKPEPSINLDVKNYVENLTIFSHDEKRLTSLYTEIFDDESVVYTITRISQYPIFKEHFPELYQKNEYGESVINCQQNSPYHKYGVFKHTLYTMEYVAQGKLNYSKNERRILKWTMFLHDIGKPYVKKVTLSGHDSFEGHDDMSVTIARRILDRFEFSDSDKKTILTLIKYHDRYLNEGELTYDNLRFLAQELDNKRDLFNLLIDVKMADNRAKSTEVYNTFKKVLPKYTEFVDGYFDFEQIAEKDDSVIVKLEKEEKKETKKEIGKKNKNLSDAEFEEIYNELVKGTGLKLYYQPVVNVRNMELYGYDVSCDLDDESVSLPSFLRKAEDCNKYEKVNNLILLQTLDQIKSTGIGSDEFVLIKTDVSSIIKYNNIGRIYDVTEKNGIALKMINMDNANVAEIRKFSASMRIKKAIVVVDHVERSKKEIDILDKCEFDMLRFCIGAKLTENEKNKLKELSAYCAANYKKLLVTQVDDVQTYKDVVKCGADYVQGKCIGEVCEQMDYKVKEIIDNKTDAEESIV